MNFFQQLAALMNGFDVIITVRKHKDATLTVSVIPSGKDKEKTMAPMTFTGTPDEMDEDLLNLIAEPLEKHVGIIADTTAFQESAKEPEKKTTPVKTKKKEEPPKPKPFDVAITAGDDAMTKKDWPLAVKEYEKALKIDPASKVVKTKLLEAKTNKMKQEAGLFEDDEESAPTETPVKATHVPGTITPNPKADVAVVEQENADEFDEFEADPTNDDDVENF